MKVLLAIVFASMLAFAANAQDSPYRKEIKRADLTGTNMEVITSIVELNPGESSTLHIHHGEESFYVLEGGTIERADGKQVPFPTGFSGINARDVERTARRAGPVLHDQPRDSRSHMYRKAATADQGRGPHADENRPHSIPLLEAEFDSQFLLGHSVGASRLSVKQKC